jgi:integrase/recombinase XerD
MSDLRTVLHDYLGVRRSLGYQLVVAERLLGQFIDFLEESGAAVITTELAVRWATLPSAASPGWLGQRLSVVRCFAIFAQTIETETQVPPTDLLAGRPRRAVPYLYSDAEIMAIMAASRRLPSRHLTPHTYETLVGLLATTGLRVSEAIGLGRDNMCLDDSLVRVIGTKFNKSREVPLSESAVEALRRYERLRDEFVPSPRHESFLLSTTGTRLTYNRVRVTFSGLAQTAGLSPRSERCRPRIHDLRHTFAVRTLIDWYSSGVDVAASLPLLSTVMGHVNPASTYWYLSAAPELLGLAAVRLEDTFEGER